MPASPEGPQLAYMTGASWPKKLKLAKCETSTDPAEFETITAQVEEGGYQAPGSSTICFKCGKEGHGAADCRAKTPAKKGDWMPGGNQLSPHNAQKTRS